MIIGDGLQPVERGRGISPSLSVLWALIPLLTLGWGTGFSFAYAALRLRDGILGAWAGVYFVLGLASFTLVASKSQGSWQENVGGVLALVLVGVGSAHAFAIRRRLTTGGSPRQYSTGSISPQERAVAEARTELERRREARQILKTDPELAWQLRIGRPDLPRRFQDGGLVDANHASAPALAALPGVTAKLASEIVSTRENLGGYRDLNDMSITLGIAPQMLDEAGAFLVFAKFAAKD